METQPPETEGGAAEEPRPKHAAGTGNRRPAREQHRAHLPHRHKHARRNRVRSILLVVGGIMALLLAADLVAFQGKIHARVSIADVKLGGRTPQQATDELTGLAARLGNQELRFTSEGRTFTTTAADLGWEPDPKATAQAAFDIGRSGGPIGGPLTRLKAWLLGAPVDWVDHWDRDRTSSIVDDFAQAVGVPAKEGRVWIEGTTVMTQQPAAGRAIDEQELLERTQAALNDGDTSDVELPVGQDHAVGTPAGVAAAAEHAETIISGPVRVRIGKAALSVTPRQLGKLFQTTADPDATGVQPAVSLSPEGVEKLFAPYRAQVETEPRSAEFIGSGKDIEIKPSKPGRVIDAEVAAGALLKLALSSSRTGKIPLTPKEAEFTTEEASALGIDKKISSFTTFYPPGEPRVTNIHVGADVIDGTILEPGQRFSLNQKLGPRTEEKGYVSAPAIWNGMIVDQVGGGISQLTTTLYNAAFFGGYPLIEHQAHSFYFDRYPMGREATLGIPHPDLIFKNDTATPVVIDASYTESSVTVSIYGQKRYRSVRATDPVVTDRTKEGYTVVVSRIIEYPDGEEKKEAYSTFYRNELTPSPTPTPEPRNGDEAN